MNNIIDFSDKQKEKTRNAEMDRNIVEVSRITKDIADVLNQTSEDNQILTISMLLAYLIRLNPTNEEFTLRKIEVCDKYLKDLL